MKESANFLKPLEPRLPAENFAKRCGKVLKPRPCLFGRWSSQQPIHFLDQVYTVLLGNLKFAEGLRVDGDIVVSS